MDKRSLSEREICTKFITPALCNAGWDEMSQIRGAVNFTDVPRGVADPMAKQFDLLMLNAMLRLLRGNATFTKFRTRIRKIASDLEGLSNIPMVQHQLPLIEEIQTDAFWPDIVVETLETVRLALRNLVQLIEPVERKIVYTDFVDEIGEGSEIEVDQVSPGIDMARFRMKVRRFIEKHRDHVTIQKLRRVEQLTATDLGELQSMFDAEASVDAAGQAEIVQAGGLGLFLRSLVGLERKAAKQAFDAFTEGRRFTASQVEFIDQVIEHLTDRGMIDPRRFYESPFTDIDSKGINGIFAEADVEEIVRIVKRVEKTAAA